MWHVSLFLLFQYLLLCTQFESIVAFIGHNIRRARYNEFPFVVSISHKTRRFNPLTDHMCTGTLISKQHVITAEHCMRPNLAHTVVLVGQNNIYNCKPYNIKAWISYAQWIEQNKYKLQYEENDISIITLEKNIEEDIEPAALTTQTEKQLVGSSVIMAGWGRSDTVKVAILMETTMVQVLNKKACLKRVDKLAKKSLMVPDSVICTAAVPYTLMDCGESGGPLLDTNNILVGVNEGTTPKTDMEFHPEEVNIHSSISFYRNFIEYVLHNSH